MIYLNDEKGKNSIDTEREKSLEYKIPIWQKITLKPEEAAEYSNIGIHKIRDLTKEKRCPFVLHVGNKILIKRKAFEKYIENQTYI